MYIYVYIYIYIYIYIYTVNSRCNAVFGVQKIRTAVLRMRGIKIRPVSK